MNFWKRKKEIKSGDLCTVNVTGMPNVPIIMHENNEVLFIGEYTSNKEKIAICSSAFVNELIFLPKNILARKSKQPTKAERMEAMQIDILTTVKELSFQLKTLMLVPPPVNDFEEPQLTQKESRNLH